MIRANEDWGSIEHVERELEASGAYVGNVDREQARAHLNARYIGARDEPARPVLAAANVE